MSDSFADLWNSLATDPSKSQRHDATRTLAERQSAAAQEQSERLERERATKEKEAQAWSGLDLLGQHSQSLSKPISASSAPAASVRSVADTDWISNHPHPPATSA